MYTADVVEMRRAKGRRDWRRGRDTCRERSDDQGRDDMTK
jgi:hypothetical protein